MPSKRTDYEWLFAEREGEWSSPAGTLSEKEVAPRVSDSYISKLRLWTFLALLLLQGVGGYLLWHYAEAGWNQIEVEIRSAVDADDWVIKYPPKPSSDTVGNRQEAEHSSATLEMIPHPPIGSEMPGIEVESIRIDGSVAIVQVVVTETHSSGESITYRESRFFQQSGQGWRRSKPQPEWFGPWQTLETDSFRIHYRQLSAQMIQDAVPRLEAMVKLLRHDFGLPATTGHPKVLIEVSDVKTLPMVALVAAANGTILVPMPALLQIPAEMPPDQAFVQSVIHSLASLLIREVEAQQPYEWPSHTKRGRLMLNALAFWELWAGDEPVVGWRLDSADSTSVDGLNASQVSPCSIYNVWDLSITAISSPLSCRTMVWQIQSEILLTPILLTSYDLFSESPFLRHLPTLSESEILSHNYPFAQPSWSITLALSTVIDYAVITYGRKGLPSLIAGCSVYASWDELIPAIYGIPTHEFEQGWQRYLAEKYFIEKTRKSGTYLLD